MSVLMADSTRPWLIPASFKYALAYGNGAYEWADDQVDRFAGHVTIGVRAGHPEQAETCRELDVERWDARPEDAPGFLARRAELGHDDGTIYCSRSLILPVLWACTAAGVVVPRWHVATLDGTRVVQVPSGVLWAVQFAGEGTYDVSVVYGPYDWSTR